MSKHENCYGGVWPKTVLGWAITLATGFPLAILAAAVLPGPAKLVAPFGLALGSLIGKTIEELK